MTDEVGTQGLSSDLVLELLGIIRGDIGELKTDMVKLKERLSLLEETTSSMSRRLDRVGAEVEQVKFRPQLMDAD